MELHKNARSCPASRVLSGSSNPWRDARDRGRLGGRCIEKDGLQVEEAIRRGRRGGPGRSQFPASSDASADPSRIVSRRCCVLRKRRNTGPQIAARVGLSYGHRSPHPGSPRPLPPQEPRAQRACRPLPERSPWRADPRRYQEVGPYRPHRPSHPWDRTTRAVASAGSSSMSPSTTPLAWPMPRSCPTRDLPPPQASSDARSSGSRTAASASRPSCPTMAPATSLTGSKPPARSSSSVICAPDPTAPNQRKSRTLHPDPASRMGLQTPLLNLSPENRPPPSIPQPLQSQETPCRSQQTHPSSTPQ